MIRSFGDRETRRLFERERSRRLPANLQRIALRKLRMLHRAQTLDDLRNPPGNHLEALSRDRKEQLSIRINRQWRICFRWVDGDAHQVEVTDYH